MRSLAACAACIPIAVSPPRAEGTTANELVFAPPLETPLSYVSRGSIELVLEKSEVHVRNDRWDFPEWKSHARGLAEEGDTIAIAWSSLCRDTVHSVCPTRPLRFDREWGQLELSMEREGDELLEPTSLRIESELVDEAAEHSWVAGEGSYRAIPAHDRRVPLSDPIASLREPLAFPSILEGRTPEDAREWSVDPARFMASIWPGGWGELGYRDVAEWPSVVVGVPTLPPYPEFWLEGVEGDVRAVLQPARRVDGEDLEIVRIEFELASKQDFGDWMLALGWRFHWAQDLDDLYDGEIRWTWNGTGELRWSKARSALASLVLDGALGVDYDLGCRFEWFQPGYSLTVRLVESWEGTLSFREIDP